MIRPIECSKGKLNTSEIASKNSSGTCTSHCRRLPRQKNRAISVINESSDRDTSVQKFKNSTTGNTHKCHSESFKTITPQSLDVAEFHGKPSIIIPQESLCSSKLSFSPYIPSEYVRKQDLTFKSHGMSRSKSMRMEKCEKKFKVNNNRSTLIHQSNQSFFKSFDDLASAIFQENTFKKTSTLLRQQTTIAERKQYTMDAMRSEPKDLPDSVFYTSEGLPKHKISKLSTPCRNKGLIDSWKRRTGFTHTNRKNIDKGQVDLEMIISAKTTASSLKGTMGKGWFKAKAPPLNHEYTCARVQKSNSCKTNSICISDNELEGGTNVVDQNLHTNNYHQVGCKKIMKAKSPPKWTISIADPDGDVFEVNSNIKGRGSLEDMEPVCRVKLQKLL